MARSDSYQYLFHESLCTMEQWNAVDHVRQLTFWQQHVERMQEELEYLSYLDNQLYEELLSLIMSECTPHQIAVVKLIQQNKTQDEIAKILQCNQSGVHKSLRGNHIYLPNGQRTTNGGLATKLHKKLLHNSKMHDIMKQMFEHDPSGYTVTYCTLRRSFPSWQNYKQWVEQ